MNDRVAGGTRNMLKRIAIANRGESARRLIRAVRDYNLERGTNIETVALVTPPDADAPFAYEADRIEMLASGAGVRGYFDGGDGGDVLIGGSYNDTLLGGNGKDLFFARDGVSDTLLGGKGNDKAEADAVDVLIDVKGKKSVKGKTQ